MNCQDFAELAGAYALGALTDEERHEAEQHLSQCPSCQQTLRELQSIANVLPLAVPTLEPSPRVKERLFATIQAEAPEVHAVQTLLPPEQMPLPLQQRQKPRSWWAYRETRLVLVAAVLLLALLAGMGVWNVLLQRQIAQNSTRPTAPLTATIRGNSLANAAHGQLVYLPQLHLTTLVIRGLPTLPGTNIYQGWAIMGKQPVSIGQFNVQDGIAILTVSNDVRNYDAVAISQEPGPELSSGKPRGQIVAEGTLPRLQTEAK